MLWINLIFIGAGLWGLYRIFKTFRQNGGLSKTIAHNGRRMVGAFAVGLWLVLWIGAFLPDGEGTFFWEKAYNLYQLQYSDASYGERA